MRRSGHGLHDLAQEPPTLNSRPKQGSQSLLPDMGVLPSASILLAATRRAQKAFIEAYIYIYIYIYIHMVDW